ncbi:MAG: hypothetical protein PHS41_00725 [Victivallaceae bacterium]|nr:hypothetical protein [Victivallaceae bacterium]
MGAAILFLGGCATPLPPMDIDVPTVCKNEIQTLQNPAIKRNTEEKYRAAKSLVRKIDFTFLPDLPTVEKIFGRRDAVIDRADDENQVIIYYYTWKNHFVRVAFWRYKHLITKCEIKEE